MKTYQSRGYDHALYGLGFIKQLQLFYDVHLSADVDSSVQPPVICRKETYNPVKLDASEAVRTTYRGTSKIYDYLY